MEGNFVDGASALRQHDRVSVETVFLVVNFGVIPFWALLAIAPRGPWTDRLVHSPLPALLLVPVYAGMLFLDKPGPQGASFLSLEGVTRIFTTPQTILACWIHYLVFDLFVGAWEARDGARLGIPRAAMAPCLFVTLMFGPIGFFLYLALRFALRRRTTLVEGALATSS